jgi:hypothetical protein
MSRKRRWLFRLLAILLGLVLAELILDVGALISPRLHYYLSPPWKRVVIADPVLGWRTSPFYPGNDRFGYRNPAVPEHCEILAVGASMTYGYAATADKAYPRQLERITGKSVYNMSCGGYSPCEFKVLAERGLKMTAKIVLVEMYPGNAIRNAYVSVYGCGRFSELHSQDEQLLSDFRRLDREKGAFTVCAQEALAGNQVDDQGGVVARSPVRTFLSERCALYALARSVYWLATNQKEASPLREDQPRQDSYEVVAQRPLRVPFDDPKVRTVFANPEGVKMAMDLNDSRIREGVRIVETVFQSMQVELKSKGIRFVVVLIPSKPLVYESLAKKHVPPMPASWFEAVDVEQRMRANFLDFFAKHQIECVNPLASMSSRILEGSQLFPESDDVHLNANGYKVLAESVAEFLASGHDGPGAGRPHQSPPPLLGEP